MKNRLIKFLSLTLAIIIAFSSIPIQAADFSVTTDTTGNSNEYIEYQSTDDDDFTPQTSVFAQVGSLYKVTIPKVIVLSGISKKAGYYVDVTGDISGSEVVRVVPESSVSLSSNNKNVETGYITQDRILWSCQDFSTKANGQVVANGLTAGRWMGTFWFNIEIKEVEGEKVLGNIIIPPIDEIEENITLDDVYLRVGESKLIKTALNNTDLLGDFDISSSKPNIVKIEDNKIIGINVGTSVATVAIQKEDKTVTITFNIVVSEANKPVNWHTHTPADAVRENEIVADCENDGSYDEVVYCAECGEELSRTAKTIQASGHTAGTPIKENEVATTCESDGYWEMATYCTKCGKELSRSGVSELMYGHNYVEGECTRCGDKLDDLNVTANEYTGTYDGNAHSISVISEGNTITYSTDNLTFNSTKPEYKNVGTYTVYYKVTKPGYKTVTGSKQVVINKADGSVVAPTAKTGLKCSTTDQTLINAGSSTTGTIQYKLNNGSYSNNVPVAKTAGTYTIYYKVVGDANHKDVAEKSISVVIEHNPANAVRENEVVATCTEDGSYDEVIKCSGCGEELSRTTKIINATGHNFVDNICIKCNLINIKNINLESGEVVQTYNRNNFPEIDTTGNVTYYYAGNGFYALNQINSNAPKTDVKSAVNSGAWPISNYSWVGDNAIKSTYDNRTFYQSQPDEFFENGAVIEFMDKNGEWDDEILTSEFGDGNGSQVFNPTILSNVENWYNNKNWFSNPEKQAIKAATVNTDGINANGAFADSNQTNHGNGKDYLENAHLFAPSIDELMKNPQITVVTANTGNQNLWTRSFWGIGNYQARRYAWDFDTVDGLDLDSPGRVFAVAPAFYLNLGKLVTAKEAITGVETTIGLKKFDKNSFGNNIKFVVKDENFAPNFSANIVVDNNNGILAGKTYKINFDGVRVWFNKDGDVVPYVNDGGTDNNSRLFISAIIYDKDGNIKYYGPLMKLTSDKSVIDPGDLSGSCYITIPEDLDDEEGYIVSIFEEQVGGKTNENYETDYISNMQTYYKLAN